MKISMLIAEKTVSKALFTLYIMCVGYIIQNKICVGLPVSGRSPKTKAVSS